MWSNPIPVLIDPFNGSTRKSWESTNYTAFMPPAVPSVCTDGSNSRPYLAFRWFSGAGLKNGTAWRTTSKLTLSSCGYAAARRPALSVRKSKNLASPAAGPFTCVSRATGGCGTGNYGFKLALTVEANTHYWFVMTPHNTTSPPSKFNLTTLLTF